jgi:tRNA-2-methylthio-N6-dimethylallyladenosine synthase
MPFLHLPIQSGSDRVLKAMNRGHTTAEYVKLIERIRMSQPKIALSGDFIVGFPGESDAEFEETMALVREVNYASAFSFKYSPRPGTPAAENTKQIPDAVKTKRLYRLQELLAAQTKAFNEACVGQVMPVLLEKPGREKGQLIGRSPYLQSVHLEAPKEALGTLVETKIIGVGSNSLSAHYIKAESKGDSTI